MLQTRIIPPTPSAYTCPLLIKRLLLSGARYERTREIIYRDKLRYDYATLTQRVARLANVLTEAGVKAGDTVAVLDWDSHRYLECMFAVPMIGAVLHTVNVRLSPEQILYTMNHAEDHMVLVNSDFLPVYRALSSKLSTVRNTILLTDDDVQETLPDMVGEYEQLLAAAEPVYDFPDFDENSVATTFYTTGTTGDPKGVYFTHRQLVLHTLSLAAGVGSLDSIRLMGNSDVYMPLTPMFHVHAWGMPYAATMMGTKQVYPGRYDPELIVDLILRENVSFTHCVPTVLRMLLQAAAARDERFADLKMIIGGSALPRALYDEAKKQGVQLTAAYGMSETCPLICVGYLSEEVLAGDEESCIRARIRAGVPVPLVDVALMDAEGNFLAEDGDTQGELVLRAPWLTQGYVHEPDKSEELWRHGWLHTGDVAAIDELSSIEIRDRIKDVIKTGGEWISSLELENLISSHPDVREAAVIGMPDEQWGERPHALLTLNQGKTLSVEDLRSFMMTFVTQGKINKWAIPNRISVVDEIPKTSVGKLDKKRIRTWLDAQ